MIENEYYTLKELMTIVNLKYRQIQKRLKVIIEKYENVKDKLIKISNRWYIHKSLLNEFDRIRNQIEYKLFITITLDYKTLQYYWRHIISLINRRLMKIDKKIRVKYVIEYKYQTYHLHFMTTLDNKEMISKVLNDIDELSFLNYVDVDYTSVYDVEHLEEYFKKQNRPVLFPKRA